MYQKETSRDKGHYPLSVCMYISSVFTYIHKYIHEDTYREYTYILYVF